MGPLSPSMSLHCGHVQFLASGLFICSDVRIRYLFANGSCDPSTWQMAQMERHCPAQFSAAEARTHVGSMGLGGAPSPSKGWPSFTPYFRFELSGSLYVCTKYAARASQSCRIKEAKKSYIQARSSTLGPKPLLLLGNFFQLRTN